MKRSSIVAIAALAILSLTTGFASHATGSTQHEDQPDRSLSPVAHRESVSTNVYLPHVTRGGLKITNIVDGDSVAQTITLLGEYSRELQEDIWVFVMPPGGRYYPQSMNACEGERTPKVAGRWETRANFGNSDNVGQPFRIVLTIASTSASQFIADTLKEWCRTNDYRGLEILPQGVTETSRITVTRTAERWGPAPYISNTDLPGEVVITNVADGANVPQWMTIAGTYTPEATADIWLLVFAPNGRWYPQSKNACAGIHTEKANGHWQVPAGFGDAGNTGLPFDIVVVLADAQASRILGDQQREWCRENFYSGWLTIGLPQGIDEQSRIRVFRV
jgi:hypothetical protein